jgi:hypothetical protein
MNSWIPSEEQILRLDDKLCRACKAASGWLKLAVILAAVYFFVEIGVAFLPGGAVERVLGGGR